MPDPAPLLVLGLDLREDRRAPSEEWDAERRDLFLLRTDVARPLSHDPTVWPCASPEWLESVISLSSDLAAPYGSLRVEAVRALLSRDEFRAAAGTLLAVGARAMLPHEAMNLRRARLSPFASLAGPEAAPAGWTPLGWDVGDAGDLSALSNYGYHGRHPETGADWDDRASAAWAVPLLNEHHLFAREEDAARFLAWRAKATPEHRIWRLLHLWDVPRDAFLAPQD